MSVLYIVLTSILLVVCLALNVVILMQKKRTAGALPGMNDAETYWDRNKGRSIEGRLENYTKILAVAFLLITLFLNVVK